MHKKILSISFLIFTFCFLSSCIPTNSYLSVKEELTVLDIKKQYANSNILIYEQYVFVNDEENNLVFKFDKNDVVKRSESYPKVELNDMSFERLNMGTDIFKVVEKIGAPSFYGVEGNLSLDFANNEEYIFRVYFSDEGDDLMVENKDILDKDNPQTWVDPYKKELPSEEIAKSIELGMSIDEVIGLLGKPQRDIGSGVFLFEFELSNGKKLIVQFLYNIELEKEFVEKYDTHTYGVHNLFVVGTYIA